MLKALPWKPEDYWRATPSELADALRGAAHRDERDWERAAWLAAHLINVSGKSVKKNVTPQQLLGRAKRARKNPTRDWAEMVRRSRSLKAKGS